MSEVTVTLSPSTRPNGIVIRINIFLNGSLVKTLDASSSSSASTTNMTAMVDTLLAYTTYAVVSEYCTSGGCTNSSSLMVTTLETGSSVLINTLVHMRTVLNLLRRVIALHTMNDSLSVYIVNVHLHGGSTHTHIHICILSSRMC
jgi:hypothetical protein